MPRAIESLSSRKGRPPVYPWDEWVTEGATLAFDKGEKDDDGEVVTEGDFYCKASSFETQIRTAAEDRGLRASIRKPGDGVIEVEFVAADEDDTEA